MSRAPISRRRLMAGTGAMLAVAALPAGVVESVAAEMPSTADLAGLPEVFDPAAFVADLKAAGYRIHSSVPVWRGFDNDDRQPSYFISPPRGAASAKATPP